MAIKTELKVQERQRLSEDFVRGFEKRYIEAWNGHDLVRVLALFTEDILYEDPLILPDGLARGHEELRTAAQRWWSSMPDLKFATSDLFLSLDARKAAHAWTASGTMTGAMSPPGFAPTNKPIQMSGVTIWEFRGDRVAHLKENTDLYSVARQVGALPEPGTANERIAVLLQKLEARHLRRS